MKIILHVEWYASDVWIVWVKSIICQEYSNGKLLKKGVYQYVYEPLPHWNIAEQQAYISMYMSPHPATPNDNQM